MSFATRTLDKGWFGHVSHFWDTTSASFKVPDSAWHTPLDPTGSFKLPRFPNHLSLLNRVQPLIIHSLFFAIGHTLASLVHSQRASCLARL